LVKRPSQKFQKTKKADLNMTVNVLGAEWTVTVCPQSDDPKLAEMDGYTDWTTRMVVVCDVEPETDSVNDIEAYKKKVLRHEIIHAFLFEAGLADCSGSVSSWATNEEMVDWFAFNGAKIYDAWWSVGAV